jgi:hypothetical protein
MPLQPRLKRKTHRITLGQQAAICSWITHKLRYRAIFKKKEVSDDEIAFELAFELPFNLGYGKKVTMKKAGGEWKAEW